MGKIVFNSGDCVSCKKWSGEQFLGIFECTYQLDSSHCVIDVNTGKRYNVYPKDIKMATEDEAKQIKRISKEKNIVPRKNISNTVAKTKCNYEKEMEAALEAAD
jgi:hypothetical protein